MGSEWVNVCSRQLEVAELATVSVLLCSSARLNFSLSLSCSRYENIFFLMPTTNKIENYIAKFNSVCVSCDVFSVHKCTLTKYNKFHMHDTKSTVLWISYRYSYYLLVIFCVLLKKMGEYRCLFTRSLHDILFVMLFELIEMHLSFTTFYLRIFVLIMLRNVWVPLLFQYSNLSF